MAELNLKFDCEEVMRLIANYAVGIGLITREAGKENVEFIGSGTLVTLGPVKGVLTAAHVLENLPPRGEVALVRFPNKPETVQKQTINMCEAEAVIIAGPRNCRDGPDIGFLRLPTVNIENLTATNNFRDIARHREVPPPSGAAFVDAVVGVVHQWTEQLPPHQPDSVRIGVNALFAGGSVIAKRDVGAYDIWEFVPSFDPSMNAPSSYGGVSGGGLWRIFFKPNGSNEVLEHRLMGVAFFEEQSLGREMHIVCHGPRSVYAHLVDAVRERWS